MHTNNFIDFLNASKNQYFAAKNLEALLVAQGYKELKSTEAFTLDGEKFFLRLDDTGILAVNIGADADRFNIVGSHTDSPAFRIKANPVMKKEGCVLLNTEVYGGPIYSTWLDRPLSIAGRVSVLEEGHVVMKHVDFEKPVCTIPSLAIHMNRDVNKGFELNPQTHLLPLVGMDHEGMTETVLLEQVAALVGGEILDYDLYLYDTQPADRIGFNEELIQCGRQDNLFMAYTSLIAFLEAGDHTAINVFLATDNEEVGSTSYAGADSPVLGRLLERLALALGKDRDEYLAMIERSFLISADAAHAVHPSYPEAADPTNRPRLGAGPVIKYAANRAYTSDAYSAGRFIHYCNLANVPYQTYHNRSDKKGGSTIGPISTSQIAIHSVDIGMSTLGMHACRELTGAKDVDYFIDVFKVFYEEN
ncbi:M18 family aminopeptidase [Peptoniphilus equinus]|uniref:M18 family aminopeptidase n=1 Tax=Peptoniphilus equinus TaxID=3016343 RepID=A0ABY7QTH0_9FIRM|nr:M18 family aminopeptidase [Peptoniphilus equinus]WBW50090.1 M18 family aminopeptidase [Peptoniphilus equinus]